MLQCSLRFNNLVSVDAAVNYYIALLHVAAIVLHKKHLTTLQTILPYSQHVDYELCITWH
jgi:hypothetical protein